MFLKYRKWTWNGRDASIKILSHVSSSVHSTCHRTARRTSPNSSSTAKCLQKHRSNYTPPPPPLYYILYFKTRFTISVNPISRRSWTRPRIISCLPLDTNWITRSVHSCTSCRTLDYPMSYDKSPTYPSTKYYSSAPCAANELVYAHTHSLRFFFFWLIFSHHSRGWSNRQHITNSSLGI